ncbi:response regulator transcription factor [Roseovarius sp. EL26]|uniref:response regulator transcription factor n=1 Tax=Roseovarius sp. EL26 TaxID=2126672 RepID=UPI000EA29638|nr:response regulator transcription factor [Roseovarius sp. EL26]
MRLIVVEDNEQIAEFLVRGLRAEGYVVDLCRDGKSGFERARNDEWHAIILDLMLPEMDGRQICYELRAQGIQTPIVMLTALDSSEDIVTGLKMGADDYMTKPFSFEELLARINNVISRRSGQQPTSLQKSLQVEDLRFDLDKLTVSRGDRFIELTSLEYALLEYLMREAGNVLSRAKILQNVWVTSVDPLTNVVEVYMSRLRKKIDMEPEKKLVHNIRGRGYLLGIR